MQGDSPAGSVAVPDTAAAHADATAGGASLLEGQPGLWPGFARSATQTGEAL